MKPDSMEIIARQSVEIIRLRHYIKGLHDAIHDAVGVMVCVGGPLNDNLKEYSAEQKKDFHQINTRLKHALSECPECGTFLED